MKTNSNLAHVIIFIKINHILTDFIIKNAFNKCLILLRENATNFCQDFMINTRENIFKPSAFDNIYKNKPYSYCIFLKKCFIKISNFTKGIYY